MQPLPAPARPLAPAEAAGEALELVRRRLFPFRFDRWLRLGVVAFLDSCGRGHFGGGFPGGGGSGGSGGGAGAGGADVSGPFERAADWIGAHIAIVGAIAVGVLLLILALSALATWLHSRGVFMYLDDVATGRDDVARPWHEHRRHASSYFAWRFGLSLVTLCAVLALLVPGGLLVWSMVRRNAVACGPVAGLVALAGVLVVFLLASALFAILLRDLAAPLQMVLGVPCGAAARVAWGLVKANPGTFVLYLLLKIVFAVVLGIAALLGGCITCCVGFLPVLSQTLLQPLLYFERAWSLFLLRQAGYDIFPAAPAPPPEPPPFPPTPFPEASFG